LFPEAIQESQMQVLDRVSLDIRQEFRPIALHRFDVAGLAHETDHETVAEQILIAETILCQRDTAQKRTWIKVV